MFRQKWNKYILNIRKAVYPIKKAFLECRTNPQPKYFIKLLINCSSRECWAICNTNRVRKPILLWFEVISIHKLPSPFTKPAIHSGSLILIISTLGLWTSVIEGKAAFNSSFNPLLLLPFIATILCKPWTIKCSLFLTRESTLSHNSKSARFYCVMDIC